MLSTSGTPLFCFTGLRRLRASIRPGYSKPCTSHCNKQCFVRTLSRQQVAARVTKLVAEQTDNQSLEQSQASYVRPAIQRALGVDYGRRLIGLAVSTLGLAPRALPPIPGGRASDVPRLAMEIVEKAKSEGCQGIVIGLPVTRKGVLWRPWTDSQQGRRCRNFALNVAAFAESSGLHVFLVDEAGTTAFAHELMYSTGSSRISTKKMKDSVAAALILEKYFDGSEVYHVRPAQWR